MIERLDRKTVRIRLGNSWHYLEITEDNNLVVVERVFLKGFEASQQHNKLKS